MGKAIPKPHNINNAPKELMEEDFPDSLFKAAFKITNNGMAILDRAIPLEVNNQFLWIVKRTREEVIGKDLMQYVYKDDLERAKEEMIKNREVVYEVRYTKGDGTLGHLELRGHPIVYKGKKCRLLIIRENEMLYNFANSDDKKKILFIKTDSRLTRIRTKDIIYIEALKDYVNIYSVDNKYVIRSTMKGIEDKLPADRFARVHRSFIVAVGKVSTIDHAKVLLENGASVPLGGLYKEQFLEKLNMV
jgi:PAS domain S-box-containing protein